MEDYPGLLGWALNAITYTLVKRREREIWHRQKIGQCDHRNREWSDATTHHQARNSGWKLLPEAGRGKDWKLFYSLWRKCGPASTSIPAQWYWFQISVL
jgi:hypothetical protein